MKNFKYIKTITLTLLCSIIFTGSNLYFDKVIAEPIAPAMVQVQNNQKNTVSPLDIINSPKLFLNKSIAMNAKFDKFSTLGLDYKSALRNSEEYISFFPFPIFFFLVNI